jgi:addiction module RelB/DinJ family antitoxin
MASSTLFRARVPTERLRRAEKVFARLGMKPGDAFNIFLAQVELRNDLPFAVTTNVDRLLTTEEQGKTWENALGEYSGAFQ